MRWFAGLIALCVAGCGQPFSNDDLVFIKSLPNGDLLKVDVPKEETAAAGLTLAQSICRRPPQYYFHMRDLSVGLTKHIEDMLKVVDTIITHPPTDRDVDLRRWGPFKDDKSGREHELVVRRTRTATVIKPLSKLPPFELDELFGYTLRCRNADEQWQELLRGKYSPSGTVERGLGTLALDFDALAAVDPNTKERGQMVIGYDTRDVAVALELEIFNFSGDAEPPVEFSHYDYTGAPDGSGSFGFDLTVDVHQDDEVPMPERENLRAFGRWLGDNRGRIDVSVSEGELGMELRVSECWDRTFFMTYRQWSVDPPGLECGGADRCAPEHGDAVFLPQR